MCCDGAVRYWSELSHGIQDALIALVVFVLGALLYLAGLYPLVGSDTHTPLPLRFAVLALICTISFLRRRWPIATQLAGIVPFAIDFALGPSVPVWLVYSDFIYAAVLYGRRDRARYAMWFWTVLSVSIVLVTAVVTRQLLHTAIAVTAIFAFVGAPIWWARSVRSHKEIADAERARAQAMGLVADLDRRAAIADERKTMARDLHDVIAGHLSAIAIQSEAVLGMLARADTDPNALPDKLTGIVGSIRSNSVSALHEMRTMIGLLRRDDGESDDVAAPRGLAQLPILIDAARSAGITVRVRSRLDGLELPRAVDQAAYRIIQEALTNAMKHAPGEEVDIDMRTDTATVSLTVRNRLAAVTDPSRSALPHRGLVNMRERAVALGGTFTAGPNSGGWEVRAGLPASDTPVAEGVS